MSEYAVAVDFGKTRLRVALMDGQGRTHHVREVDSRDFTSTGDITEAIVEGAYDLLRSARQERVTGIGVGSTGAVDPATGTVSSSGSLPYLRGYDMAAQLSGRLGLPVTVVNDVSAQALGEAVYGGHGEADRVAFVNFGTGVGVALVRGRRLDFGAHGSLGLVSALPLPPDGRTLNERAGGKALAPFVGENGADGPECDAARAGAVEAAALVIGFVAGLCDPHTIAVGGGVWLRNPWFRDRVRARLHEVLGGQTTGLAVPHVVTARLGDRAGLAGAGHLGLSAGRTAAESRPPAAM
ncbi:ROK family protein [Streptomyces xanthophaeus]|uniref:ROK family protein n=1 Tax=Streptomyces xanthophaeus TaxID=67385 RepID=UPI002648188F|nr:ROK family protein [Streptomyces xanthophaeus]WKD32995.1 ROK family protein [Streptomyces xanthophaeus]